MSLDVYTICNHIHSIIKYVRNDKSRIYSWSLRVVTKLYQIIHEFTKRRDAPASPHRTLEISPPVRVVWIHGKSSNTCAFLLKSRTSNGFGGPNSETSPSSPSPTDLVKTIHQAEFQVSMPTSRGFESCYLLARRTQTNQFQWILLTLLCWISARFCFPLFSYMFLDS